MYSRSRDTWEMDLKLAYRHNIRWNIQKMRLSIAATVRTYVNPANQQGQLPTMAFYSASCTNTLPVHWQTLAGSDRLFPVKLQFQLSWHSSLALCLHKPLPSCRYHRSHLQVSLQLRRKIKNQTKHQCLGSSFTKKEKAAASAVISS